MSMNSLYNKQNIAFFKLLQLSLNEEIVESAEAIDFPKLSDSEWEVLYNEVDRQTLLGVAFSGVKKLPQELRPPIDLTFQWSSEAETVHGLNRLLNAECKRLTENFQSEGFSTAILKGQANARLYPDSLSRQPGDIDIWVSGGKNKIVDFLKKRELLCKRDLYSGHHVHLVNQGNGVVVEVHFRPSSGNLNPVTSNRLLCYLNKMILNSKLVAEGFFVPDDRFALAMQLSHIQRHFLNGGVGLRQLMDYYLLLKSSSEEDRNEISKKLRKFGLLHIAGAVMWLLHFVFGLEKDFMLCKPDKFRGEWLLRDIMHGGNFGRHKDKTRLKWLAWWVRKHQRYISNIRFDIAEAVFAEFFYLKFFVRNIPVRIKLRKISLRDVKL